MVFHENLLLSCLQCLNGHRSGSCEHTTDRDLFLLKNKGRPKTTEEPRSKDAPRVPSLNSVEFRNLHIQIMGDPVTKKMYFHQNSPPPAGPKRKTSSSSDESTSKKRKQERFEPYGGILPEGTEERLDQLCGFSCGSSTSPTSCGSETTSFSSTSSIDLTPTFESTVPPLSSDSTISTSDSAADIPFPLPSTCTDLNSREDTPPMTAGLPWPYFLLEDGALEILEACTRNMYPPYEDSQIVLGSAVKDATFPIGSEPPEEPFSPFSGALEPLGFWDLGYSAPE